MDKNTLFDIINDWSYWNKQFPEFFPTDKHQYKSFFQSHKICKEHFKTPVVIVAGGASRMDKTRIGTFGNYISELMQGFKGTVISGGTTAGIPGLVGEAKSELQKRDQVDFELIGYLPKYLPADAVKSDAYDRFYETESDDFSVLEVVSYWCDIVGNGIRPEDVILLGIEGGKISAQEYRIALSLGAKVALLANSGRAVDEIFVDEAWKNHPNLIGLSGEPLAISALVNKES